MKAVFQSGHFCRRQALSLVLFLFSCSTYAQQEYNKEFHDELPYYLGLTIGYNSSNMSVIRSNAFADNPDFRRIETKSGSGIELGLLATVPLNKHFEARFAPKLIVGGSKTLQYYYKESSPFYNLGGATAVYENDGIPSYVENIKLPSTIMSIPLHLKFHSDRIGNFRAYVFAGPKYDFNLSANSEGYKNAVLGGSYPPPSLKKGTAGFDAGLGLQIFLPYAVITPELRFGSSFQNEHLRDANNPYSNVIDQLKTRMLTFSINIEQ